MLNSTKEADVEAPADVEAHAAEYIPEHHALPLFFGLDKFREDVFFVYICLSI